MQVAEFREKKSSFAESSRVPAILTADTAGVCTGPPAKQESTNLSCCEKANTTLGCKQAGRQQSTRCHRLGLCSAVWSQLRYLLWGLGAVSW